MKQQVLLISSYPSRECGIATYSKDLVNSINKTFKNSFSVAVCALDEAKEKRSYPEEVKYILNTTDFSNYTEIANKINADTEINCVFIQHEFGLFSGSYGEHLLYLLCLLNKPIITTFHTVLPNPDIKRKSIVQTIINLSEKVIVHTKNSAEQLTNFYETSAAKIKVIPHGTHLTKWKNKNVVKSNNNLNGKLILSTFGLLGHNKSIETALDALPEIKNKFPNVLYLILGKTHPELIKHEGEKYRDFLKEKINKLELKENVLFVDQYLSLEKLLEYLSLTDVYLFTSKDPNQAVSGTFAYAMASGCPIIATPIPHAKEVLDEGTGILFDFENSDQLASAAIKLLENEKLRDNMGRNAFHKVRPTAWENVAISHLVLINELINADRKLIHELPKLSLKHLYAMTTDSGVIQFSDMDMPDIKSGYTLDDNARALIAVSKYQELTSNRSYEKQMDIYLNFIKFCQKKDGMFINYIEADGSPSSKNEVENLEDANGRAIWALGSFISSNQKIHPYFINRAENIFSKTFVWIHELSSPRAISFAIKGLYQYNIVHDSLKVKYLIHHLSKKLTTNYYDNFEKDWSWFEPYLTYANSTLPEALLYSYLTTGDQMAKVIAKESFEFLISKIYVNNTIKVISNNGWQMRGGKVNNYGEQPIDIAYTILTLKLFYEVFQEKKYLDLMEISFSWFLGNNHLKEIIYNPSTGGCCDGLEENNVNLNQGAESTICYLIARMAIETTSLKADSSIPIEKKEMLKIS